MALGSCVIKVSGFFCQLETCYGAHVLKVLNVAIVLPSIGCASDRLPSLILT